MLDFLDRLRTNQSLRDLLAHYAVLADAGREIWQDRVMALDDVDAGGLSKLHGDLIAFDWIEQNTGRFGPPKPGVVTGCYRVTSAGLRALKRIERVEVEEEAEEAAITEGEAIEETAASDVTAVLEKTAVAEVDEPHSNDGPEGELHQAETAA